ncbi:MAG: DegT/DnrJ/EryC1/StrS family aminotransferase [Hyphomicrobiales bacterium]|nr:DegT/DnrJ/EryC1/StrS family aminotransferase [Hyphomicrobiales bacterium]
MNQQVRLEQTPIPFIDVAAQRRRLGRAIDDAVARVLQHCQFIMGPEVHAVEADLAAFCGARHAVTCASGTDALLMPLMAKDIGPGDAVFTPAFTFYATAEVVALVGATPVLVDVEEHSFNLDPESLVRAIAVARERGLKPKAVIPVDLFGQPADHAAIAAIAETEGLFVLDDAAQAFGATYRNRKIGTLAAATATSFFPAKPLGCYGDGGAIFTDDDALAEILRSLRVHGEGKTRYDCARVGLNARFDTVQAAILIEKLKVFPEEIAARSRIAARYDAALADVAAVPRVAQGATSVWAQYTIRVPRERRDGFAADLKAQGIPTAIHYPKPIHLQSAYRHYPVAAGGLPVSERLAGEVISLPMHAYLEEPVQDRIIAAVRRALAA